MLASSIRHVLAQYNSAHGTTFVCDLTSLTRLLKRAAEQVQTNRDLLNQYKSSASGKAGASGGGKVGHIPEKARFADKGDKEPGKVSCSDGNVKRKYDRCAKWKPEVKHTHWTKDCKIFEADGLRKPHGNGDKRGGVRGHTKYNNVIRNVKAPKKLKDQKKKHKKARRKRQRHGEYASSSSSSSSDSK